MIMLFGVNLGAIRMVPMSSSIAGVWDKIEILEKKTIRISAPGGSSQFRVCASPVSKISISVA
jgi:hypothetical protein